MSYVFLSYSKKNTNYAKQLEKNLLQEGFNVWIDHHIRVGDDWWDTIDNAIKDCGVVVVIVSSSSQRSKWVKREVLLAENRDKPRFPLLLDGDEWSLIIDLQHEDVRSRDMPSEVFFQKLASYIERNPNRGEAIRPKRVTPLGFTQALPDASVFEDDEDEIDEFDSRVTITGPTHLIFDLQEKTRLGRSEPNDIILNSDSVSRFHAEINYDGNNYIITDLNSENGTFINNQRIRKATVLKDEDKIGLGQDASLRISLSDEPQISVEHSSNLTEDTEADTIVPKAPKGTPLSSQDTASIMFLNGRQRGRSVNLYYERMTIGRSASGSPSEIVIKDRSVSRFHAIFQRVNDVMTVVDAGSRNGTLVNGVKITDNRKLTDGDTIQIGNIKMLYQVEYASTTDDLPTAPPRDF